MNTAPLKTSMDQPRTPVRLPELLAPAGDWDCARAAVENGADAIYFGLDRHNARMRAKNFTLEDLPRFLEFLHKRGVRGYVTFNTLVFTDELKEAEETLRGIIAAGADAIVVQDVGIARMIRAISSDFPIHASTQMTVTSAQGVAFAQEIGSTLAVLGRECSLPEIVSIHAATANPLPLQVFVHGALCVAYSGQCLTSESLGGRSANRGVCAQACRMPYQLKVDGELMPLGDQRYLLSPQDLAGLAVLPDLVRAGVHSLKIEGRLKAPEYVSNIVRLYRRALDQIGKLGLPIADWPKVSGLSAPIEPVTAQDHPQYRMEMAFSRGLYTGWLRGTNHRDLIHARFGKKRGLYLGEVLHMLDDGIVTRLRGPLKQGDGIVFDAGQPDQDEEGGRVYEIKPNATGEVILRFGWNDIDLNRVHQGDKIWKTNDPELDRRVRQTYEGDKIRFQRPIDFEITGKAGEPLRLAASDDHGHRIEMQSAMPLVAAENRPLTQERLQEQLSRMGGTPFRLEWLDVRLEGQVLLPVSEVNRLRREIVAQMEQIWAMPPKWNYNPNPCQWLTGAFAMNERGNTPHPSPLPQGDEGACALTPTLSHPMGEGEKATNVTPELIVLVRNMAQLEAALAADVTTVYCEFEDPKKYRDAVARFRQWQSERSSAGNTDANSSSIYVAPPRIFKTGEEWVLKQVQSSAPDGYLVRNFDHLAYFSGSRCVGDYSLNIANPLSAQYFMEHFHLERVTASYDLNLEQLQALLRAAPPEWFEITLHQHLPMFHMEYCVFCKFLSKGTDYTNCGRPCDTHDVQLRDRVGMDHPVKADAGCRNTVFNAQAQTGAESASKLLALGVRRFRLEFLNETPEDVTRTIGQYRKLLTGEVGGGDLWRELKLLNQIGVTRGQMLKPEGAAEE